MTEKEIVQALRMKPDRLRELAEADKDGRVVVIPKIEDGLRKLEQNQDSFKEYEEPNGWGSVKGTAQFFRNILNDWNDFQQWYEELVPVATFWIE